MNYKALLRISVQALFEYADFIKPTFSDYLRKATVEPIIIDTGSSDMVLMSGEAYRRLSEENVLWSDGDFGSEFITQQEFDRRQQPRAAKRPTHPFDGLHPDDRGEATRFIAYLRARRTQFT